MLQFSEKLLNNLMQIGLTVSLAALVPLILRRLMKKRYPARMVCVVWAILALRLLIPVQLTLPQAPVQVMPRTSYVVQSDQTAFRQAGLPVAQNPTRWVTGTQAETLSAADTGTVKTVDITDILLALWLAGVIACVLWQGIGYYRLIRSLKGTAIYREGGQWHMGRITVARRLRGQHKGTFLLKRVLDDVFAQDVDNIFLEARDATVHILTGFGAEIAGEPFAFYCGNVTPMILTRTAFLQHTNG